MIKGLESLVIFSENAQKLADFYKDKVGLKVALEAELGEKGEEANLFNFDFGGGASLAIMDHSEIHGQSKEPSRLIFNLEVDNIELEAKRLEEAQVKKIQDIYHVEGYGLIATFEDTDGNYFQLAQTQEG